MRINRFLMKFDLNQDNLRIDDFEIYNQIRNVLKLKPGERIILFDGETNEVVVEILSIDHQNKIIDLIVLERRKNQQELEKEIILYCSILKRENFELVVEKATEIGIKRIVPIICERTVKTGIRKERLKKIIKEASEQSGRGIIPELSDAIDFNQAIEQAKENNLNLFFDISGTNLKNIKIIGNQIGLFIGPEGGWGENEINMAKNNNFKIIKLSEFTLRAETATIVASYLAINN